jgi:hypothetical protein
MQLQEGKPSYNFLLSYEAVIKYISMNLGNKKHFWRSTGRHWPNPFYCWEDTWPTASRLLQTTISFS